MTLLLIIFDPGASSSEIYCEVIQPSLGKTSSKECLLTLITVIDAPGYVLRGEEDENVKRVSMVYNKKIQFLPENSYEAFPDLTHLDAAACAVKEISSKNFRNLFKLAVIALDGNLIERIAGDTFDGLTSLKEIYLGKIDLS